MEYSRKIDKQILVGFPSALHIMVKEMAQKNFMSVSAFIRSCVLEKIDDEFTQEEILLIERGIKESREGKTTNWSSIQKDN